VTNRASPSNRTLFNPDAADTDFDAVIAKVIALATRNGIEDLHANGAFSDRQAPALNRRIRGRIYELLIANRLRDASRNDDPFSQYIDHLAEGHKGGHIVAALQGAISRAVDDFATADAIERDTAAKLCTAATKAAVEAWKTINRLSLHRSKDEKKDQFAVGWWLSSIPDYWEEPEVSSEFQKLLDDA
jgi:hypothetical protein